MSNIITKTFSLLSQKQKKQFIEKAASYIRYLACFSWYRLTLKETDPDLKKVNKNWVIYTFLRCKYSRFLKNYEKKEKRPHEYSDFVWWCWFQGEENAPEVAKACLASLRKNMPEKKIVVITEKNMWDYVSMPDFIKEKYKKGIITKTHFSDLLRLELLINYGGAWIDSTVFCSANPQYAFNCPLFVFKTNEKNDPATAAQSWFISAEKQNPILILTRDLLFEYWEKKNFMIHYFLIYFFMKLASQKYKEEWNSIPFFSDVPPHILQRELFAEYSKERMEQLKRMSDIHKLTYKFKNPSDTQKKGTIYQHLLKESDTPFRTDGEGYRRRVKTLFELHAFSCKGECA